MINVKCKDDDSKTEEKNIYPCLKTTDAGRVVLFVNKHRGYELYGGNYMPNCFMYYSSAWSEDVGFVPYTGTIELRNG